MKSHTLKWKKQQLAEIKDLLNSYPVIAVADLERFPANLFAQLRKKLYPNAVVRVSKARVVQKAIEESRLKGAGLTENVKGSVGIIFSKMNPFELYGFIKKNKGAAFAKEGQLAPEDITVPAGDTGLPPGPALSDLKAAGLNVRPMGATIHVVEDKVVTKKGQPITKPVASTLSKLNIKPIKIAMRVSAALEKGLIYKADVLDIDLDQVFNDFVVAHTQAFNLAFNIAYLTVQTTPLLIGKAAREARALALEAGIFTAETTPLLLAKASAQAGALKGLVKEPAAAAEASKAEAPEKKE